MKNIFKSFAIALGACLLALGMNSCEQNPNAYEVTKGEPVIKYIITTDAAASDSIISEAYTEEVICVVGDNLRSIKKVFFNDREAILSPSFINNHTLIISVPSSLPDDITNKIYFHAENGNIVEHPFKVNAPGPSISGITCEFIPAGQSAVLMGNYFVDNATIPLQVIMPDGQLAQIDKFEQTKITFTVPEGCTEPGQIRVVTAYGEGKSTFWFNDDRNIVVDFDGSHGGNADGGGWRWGADHKHKTADWESVPAIDGDFLFLAGDLDEYGGWNDGGFEFDIWGVNLLSQPKFAAMVANNDLKDLCLKFEAYVPSAHPWGAGGLQFIWMGDETASNAPHSNPAYPRGMWRPWADENPYSTGDQWITVTIPMTEFCYDQKYHKITTLEDVSLLNGLTIFVLEGYDNDIEKGLGKKSSPWIALDNIRIVPIK